MRVAVVMALVLLSACASDRLALAPPPGVDFSGHWLLNVEESDDPSHLVQSEADLRATAGPQGQDGGRGGRGGPGGQGGGFPGGGLSGPATPAVGALSEGLRWPGKDVEIKQVAGVVAMTSAGLNEVYQPTTGDGKSHRHGKTSDAGAGGRDMRARDRGPPPTCGWDEKTLVVQSGEADDDHPPFEKRYNVSADGQRLIEVVGFKGGRSRGFTMSRVWDRVDPNAPRPAVARPPTSGILPAQQ